MFQYSYTFSKEKGLSGLNPAMFKLAEVELTSEYTTPEHEWTPPIYPCSPGCSAPTEIKIMKIGIQAGTQQWYREVALNIHILFKKTWEDTEEVCDLYSHFCWQVLQFKALPIYRCSGNQIISITTLYPPDHPHRWALAYCFTYAQLKSMKWDKIESAWRAKIPGAKIVMTHLEGGYYIVQRDDNKNCTFEIQVGDVARPLDRNESLNPCKFKASSWRRTATPEQHQGHEVTWLRTLAKMKERTNHAPTPTYELKRQIEHVVATTHEVVTPKPHPLYKGAYLQAQNRRVSPIGQKMDSPKAISKGGTDMAPIQEEEETGEIIDVATLEKELFKLSEEQNEDEVERQKQQFDKRKLQ